MKSHDRRQATGPSKERVKGKVFFHPCPNGLCALSAALSPSYCCCCHCGKSIQSSKLLALPKSEKTRRADSDCAVHICTVLCDYLHDITGGGSQRVLPVSLGEVIQLLQRQRRACACARAITMQSRPPSPLHRTVLCMYLLYRRHCTHS